jgi:hypothetical protein
MTSREEARCLCSSGIPGVAENAESRNEVGRVLSILATGGGDILLPRRPTFCLGSMLLKISEKRLARWRRIESFWKKVCDERQMTPHLVENGGEEIIK